MQSGRLIERKTRGEVMGTSINRTARAGAADFLKFDARLLQNGQQVGFDLRDTRDFSCNNGHAGQRRSIKKKFIYYRAEKNSSV